MEVSGQLHPPPLYVQGKSPWYPLGRKLGGPHRRSERGREEKNSQLLPGLEPPIIQPVAQRYTTGQEDNIKIDRKALTHGHINWIETVQYTVQWCHFVAALMNLRLQYQHEFLSLLNVSTVRPSGELVSRRNALELPKFCLFQITRRR
jgi:hypothetical protein